MRREEITVTKALYENDRATASLVSLAEGFKSSIYIEMPDKVINAKSIMGMMTLSLNKGTRFVVAADGEDENEAIDAILKFVK